MKLPRKLILSASFALALCPGIAALAFDGGPYGPDESRLDHLSDELQLTADQKAELEAIFAEKHEKVRAIREEFQESLREILSDEQLEKWEELKKQRFNKRHKLGEETP